MWRDDERPAGAVGPRAGDSRAGGHPGLELDLVEQRPGRPGHAQPAISRVVGTWTRFKHLYLETGCDQMPDRRAEQVFSVVAVQRGSHRTPPTDRLFKKRVCSFRLNTPQS